MKRRSFLSSIFAAGMAPAVVQASSIMPLWTPKKTILPGAIDGLRFAEYARIDIPRMGPSSGAFTLECWTNVGLLLHAEGQQGQWKHVAQVKRDGREYVYINGVLQQPKFDLSALRITLE